MAPTRQAPAPSAAALTSRQFDELRQLAAIGYVRGIHARLDLLGQESLDAAGETGPAPARHDATSLRSER